MDILLAVAVITIALRSLGSKTSDVIHSLKGTESERMKKWRHRHGPDFKPSGFSRYLDEAWADAAQRVADGRADRARRRAQYGYNPGAWELMRTWHANWWSDQIDKATKRHGDRVAAGRRERGEDIPGTGLGVIPDMNPGTGDARTGTEGSLGDHTVPDPQPSDRPSPDFTAPAQGDNAGPQGQVPPQHTYDSATGGSSADDAFFAFIAMMARTNHTEEEGPADSAEEPRQAPADQARPSEPTADDNIVDAEIVEDEPAPAPTELTSTEHNTEHSTEGDNTMSGTIATNQPVGGELGTVPRAQQFVSNFDQQLINAATALEFAMNDLRSAGVSGEVLNAFGTVKEQCIASRSCLQAAAVELQKHAAIGEQYRATPGAGEKAYVTGE